MALHGSDSSILEEQPIVHFIPFSGAFGVADVVICVVLFHQILHNGTRFEEVDCFTVGEGVGQRWNAAIWVDGKKPRFLLNVFGDINLLYPVGDAGKV